MLNYIGDRPLTVIRYPDGIDGKSFYSKDKPKWTPSWVASTEIEHDEKTIDYVIATDKASIVWLANLACLELHPMQFRRGLMNPDFFVIDLDPDADLDFDKVKVAAHQFNEFLRSYDYTPFVKTSGGKGLHLYVPIKPLHGFERTIVTIKSLAKEFVKLHRSLYTLQVSKSKRKGKILIDIYRNHLTNTTVAPYSLRGKKGAPISMPIRWKDLDELPKSGAFHIGNCQAYLTKHGDPWATWRDHEIALHDEKKVFGINTEMDYTGLKEYARKRDFNKTLEPKPQVDTSFKDHYVVQLHNASNLHYDLRLEENGVLLSWAVPKGLPYREGQKRLAIRTEDHPIKYLNFEGVIPKGEYGAGEMWVLHSGKIKWHKKKIDSYSFSLNSKHFSRRYSLFQTDNEDQWLISCTGEIEFFHSEQRVEPMLASSSRQLPKSDEYLYEVKWDGIRVILYIDEGDVSIYSRSGRNISQQFPEICDSDICKLEHAVLDAEIVVLDQEGRPLFHEVIGRMHLKSVTSISKSAQSKPVTCYLFDLLSMDGWNVTHLPFAKRNAWLKTVLKESYTIRYSKTFTEGEPLFEAIKEQSMEGVMAKKIDGRYEDGRRSDNWVKIKSRTLDECRIIGYTKGQGDRSELFGALHVAKESEGSLIYRGKVGSGFDHKKLKKLFELLSNQKVIQKPIENKIEEEHRSVWIETNLDCIVEYASLSSNGTYREPVFIKLKTKK